MTEQSEAGGALFQTDIFVTLRVSPEIKSRTMTRMGAFAHLAFWHPSKKSTDKLFPRSLVQELGAVTETFRLGLESAGIDVVPIIEQEQTAKIAEFFNPDRLAQVLGSDPTESHPQNLSERVTLTDLIESKSGLALGKTRIRIGTLKHLPESTVPALMHLLSGQRVSSTGRDLHGPARRSPSANDCQESSGLRKEWRREPG